MNMSTSTTRNAKGQGCFITCDDGMILFRKSAGYKADGKRKILVVKAKSKEACIKLMKEKEDKWNKQKKLYTVNSICTIEDLCTRHLNIQSENGELKPRSVDRREQTIKNQIAKYHFGHMQLGAVTPADIEDHINVLIGEGLSVSSVVKALDVLNAAYNWAIARGELDFNPVEQIKKNLKRRLSKLEEKNEFDADVIVLTNEEEKQFLNESLKKFPNGNYMYAGGLFGRLLLHTGMRVGEMISLKWEDYNKEHGILTINKSTSMCKNRNKADDENSFVPTLGSTKNQKARVISLSQEAIDDLALIREYRPGRQDDLICRTKNGKQYTATELEHCMGTIYKNLGFDEKISGLHLFRRTFATKMYEKGADAKTIAAYIGDLESTTLKYYIAVRKKMRIGNDMRQVVPLPA